MGPGTHLEKLLKRVGVRPARSCHCEARRDLMDEWGPAGCRTARHLIAEWFHPAVRPLVLLLVDCAVRRAEADEVAVRSHVGSSESERAASSNVS